MEKLLSAAGSLVQGGAAKIALSALIIDTILALVVAALLVGAKINMESVQITAVRPYNILSASAYVIFFFVIWFLLYIQTAKDNEDGYSIIRKKLTGDWTVSYTSVARPGDQYTSSIFIVGAYISINPDTRKLEINFRVEDHTIFLDEKHTVNIVALRRDTEYKYNLFYYFKNERKLQQNISSRLLADDSGLRLDKLVIEYMAYFTFEASENTINVQKMSGQWYDLNGNISRLVHLVERLKNAYVGENDVPAMRLSECGNPSFGAYMGEIEFKRGAPSAT